MRKLASREIISASVDLCDTDVCFSRERSAPEDTWNTARGQFLSLEDLHTSHQTATALQIPGRFEELIGRKKSCAFDVSPLK